jgi:hypothetical protein
MAKFTIMKKLPPGGLDAIQPGDIYERKALSKDQLATANRCWAIRSGKIQDKAREGVPVVLFVAKRGGKP